MRCQSAQTRPIPEKASNYVHAIDHNPIFLHEHLIHNGRWRWWRCETRQRWWWRRRRWGLLLLFSLRLLLDHGRGGPRVISQARRIGRKGAQLSVCSATIKTRSTQTWVHARRTPRDECAPAVKAREARSRRRGPRPRVQAVAEAPPPWSCASLKTLERRAFGREARALAPIENSAMEAESNERLHEARSGKFMSI